MKAVNTLRSLLVDEFAMQRLYERYILLHGQDVNVENAVRLLIRCKHLLKGRRILAQAMMITVERNRLMNTVKATVALDKEGE